MDIKPSPGTSVAGGVVAALEGLTKGLAVDLAPVRVNLVAPGAVGSFEYFFGTFQRSNSRNSI